MAQKDVMSHRGGGPCQEVSRHRGQRETSVRVPLYMNIQNIVFANRLLESIWFLTIFPDETMKRIPDHVGPDSWRAPPRVETTS